MDLIINPPEGSSALGGVGTIHTQSLRCKDMEGYHSMSTGVHLGILRGGVLGRNSSRGGGLESRSAGIFIY